MDFNPNGASNNYGAPGTEAYDLRQGSCQGGMVMLTLTADPMPRQY